VPAITQCLGDSLLIAAGEKDSGGIAHLLDHFFVHDDLAKIDVDVHQSQGDDKGIGASFFQRDDGTLSAIVGSAAGRGENCDLGPLAACQIDNLFPDFPLPVLTFRGAQRAANDDQRSLFVLSARGG
jgi:hypothetical protein